MKTHKTFTVAIFGLAVLFMASTAKADMVVSLRLDTNYAMNKFTTSSHVSDLKFFLDNEPIHLIYAPFSSTGGNMGIWNTNWTGTAMSLDASPFTAIQQAQLQSLFDHTYYMAYGYHGMGGSGYDTFWAPMLSNIIHAILYSSDAEGNFMYRDLGNGRYGFQNVSGWSTDLATIQLIDAHVSASLTGDWSELGYEFRATDVTFFDLTSSAFLMGRTNVPFFHVAYAEGGGGGDANVVPEPATLAVLGLGLAGLGLARRRMKQQ